MKPARKVSRSIARSYAPRPQPVGKVVKTELVKKTRRRKKP